jgi:hypothetical protein
VAESAAFRYQPYVGQDKKTTDLSVAEICAIRHNVHADIAHQSSTSTFVKTHNFFGEFEGYPLHNMEVSSSAIYIVRNPLDIAISMAKYFAYSIDEAIEYMSEEKSGTPNEAENVPQIITSWSLHAQSWTQNSDKFCLTVRYEDLLDNPRKAFRKVESFLNIPKDLKRLKKAIKHSSFGQLKAQEKQRGFVEKHENAKSFFHKGIKDQWRKELSTAQIQKIVDAHGVQMEKFNYLPK